MVKRQVTLSQNRKGVRIGRKSFPENAQCPKRGFVHVIPFEYKLPKPSMKDGIELYYANLIQNIFLFSVSGALIPQKNNRKKKTRFFFSFLNLHFIIPQTESWSVSAAVNAIGVGWGLGGGDTSQRKHTQAVKH